jgi:DNA repair protein RecN (Recombination protein N)
MLRGLHIHNMLLIDRLELEFQPGLNVLTGETGAGKSILLDSLGFVLGWRGRADLVRQGADQGEVTAWFDLPGSHPAFDVLRAAEMPADDGELILRRTNTPDGRKTAFVNDRRCSGEILRQLSDVLVELHGQHDDRGLLDPKGHRALLDDFAGIDLTKLRAAWRAAATARKELEQARAALAEAEKDADYLRHSVAELDDLAPEPGEEQALDAQRRLMQSSEKIREDIAKAGEAIGQNGADGLIGDAMRWLDGVVDKAEGRLDEPLAALGRAMSELSDAQIGVEDCLNALDFNPLELEQAEERLFAIRALARKHGVAPDDLSGFADDMRRKLQAIDTGADHLKDLTAAVKLAEAGYAEAAQAVSAARKAAAKRLDSAMAAELAPLKMERAVFATEISPADPGPDGTDQVVFTVATNPGAPAGPINRVASGGELSRFLLALKVCLTAQDTGLTMIFDEIDRGVGGATADAVGKRLSALAEGAQVLVVTHSPQVAAKGDHQWLVAKSVTDEVTTSTVQKLSQDDRTDEIARMLAGEHITAEARAAAAALLRS